MALSETALGISSMNISEEAVISPASPVMDKLFVYGTLNDPYVRRLVTGETLPVKDAILYNYRRVHPKSGYPIAVPWSGSKIEGAVIYNITPDILKKLDDYESEGTLFKREIVTVHVGERSFPAYVYTGITDALKPYFKKGVGMRDRIEAFIEKQVSMLLEAKAATYMRKDVDHQGLPLQVTKELLTEETHSLMRDYFQEAGLPVFIIKHELEQADIPSLDWIKYAPKAAEYADEYIKLAVKFMIFNQIEERFRREFCPYVKTADEYYRHTISATMALKLLVSNYRQLQLAMFELSADTYDPSFSYVDYAVAAIFIANELYTDAQAKQIAQWVRENRRNGATPLGAELEFSNIGGRVIGSKEGDDPKFDGFYYFYDFDLMRRGWKLGAHVDDHGFLTTTHTRTRGFLELAFGRYKLLGDVSKPATQDPWILSQMIELAIRFLAIRPHSLHISMQVPASMPFKPLSDPNLLLCLLLLGGDLRHDEHGTLREMRIFRKDINRETRNVHFSRLNRHHTTTDETKWHSVVEYQFSRLFFDYDYQPLIMAAKGFQLGANPLPLRGGKNCIATEHEQTRMLEDFLIRWAEHPTPVSDAVLERFISIVEEGLTHEIEFGDSKKYAQYAQRIIGRVEEQLRQRNQLIQTYYAYNNS